MFSRKKDVGSEPFGIDSSGKKNVPDSSGSRYRFQNVLYPHQHKKKNLHEACSNGRYEEVKMTIESTDKSHKIIDKKDVDGFTPLHYAVRYNYLNIVRYLLSHGANPNTKGGIDNMTPLHLAARYKLCSSLGQTRRHPGTGSDPTKDVPTVPPLAPQQTVFEAPLPVYHQKPQKKMLKTIIGGKELSYDSYGRLIQPPFMKKTKGQHHALSEGQNIQADSIIKALIMAGADINSRDKKDATPLHYAAMRRNVSSTEELLAYSLVNIECKDTLWMTPLHYAAEQGCTLIAQSLISHGADIAALNHFDMTPLHLAAEEGHPDVSELLLKTAELKGDNNLVHYINTQDRQSQTALHYSALAGNPILTNILLNNGADPFITTLQSSSTPLHLACRSGNVEVIKILLEKHPLLINKKNQNNETPLHIASLLNRENIVEIFLQMEAEIDCSDKDHETAIIMASKKDHINIVRLLHQMGGSIVNRDSDDSTPLHVAAANNSLKCAEYFLSLPESLSLQNSWDYHENRPIHLAVLNNNPDMVRLLLGFNAPTETKNDLGLTPLLIACVHGYIDILNILLEFSPALALDEDDSNNTALHLASINGHYRLISTLVNAGVNIDSRNIDQHTALDLAAKNGYFKVANILINADASVEPCETFITFSPLMIACQNGKSEVVSLLLNGGADVTREDSSGRNCIEIAIDENRRNVVLAILNSKHWDLALRHISIFKDSYCSPFRRLINIMPDVAEVVLDKCLTNNGLPISHPLYEVHCNYEYLEDQHFPWGQKLQRNLLAEPDSTKSEPVFETIGRKISSFFKNLHLHSNNKNHPLSLIIEKKRVGLLRHPLTRYLVRHKWKSYCSYIYYFRLLIFILFLTFITSFSILTASPPYACFSNISEAHSFKLRPLEHSFVDNTSSCIFCPPVPEGTTPTEIFFVAFGKYAVLLLAFISLITRIGAILMNPSNLINPQNILEILAAIFALLYVSAAFTISGKPIEIISFFRCTNYFRTFGALALCFSWLSFVLFLSKVPKIGIYVVMYKDIFRTFLQFMPIYFMLLLSFALPFYLLFLDRYDVNAYVTPFKAVMKTFMGMIGEVEYDTFYNTTSDPPVTITYFILFLFLISNPLILMNLLVGLAVDDIQGVQSNAFLKRLGLQIQMAMELEAFIPKNFQSRILKLEQSILPNAPRHHGFWSLWEFKSNPFAQDKSEDSPEGYQEKSLKELKDDIRQLKHYLKSINEKNAKIDNMIEDLLKKTDNKL